MSILDEHIEPHITSFADVSGPYGVVWGNDIQMSSINWVIENDLFEIFNSAPVVAPLELGRMVIDLFINGLGQMVLPIVNTKIPLKERFVFRKTNGTALIGANRFERGLELLYCDMVLFAYFYTKPIDEMAIIIRHYGDKKEETPTDW